MKIILLITKETLIKTEVCNYSRSARDNEVSRRIILHTDYWRTQWPAAPKCSYQTAAAACPRGLSVDYWPAFGRRTVSDKLWCVLIACIVVRIRACIKLRAKLLEHKHTCTHWSAVFFIPLPLLPRLPIDSANWAEKHSLLSALQRSQWGVDWVGSVLAVTVLRSAVCVFREGQ